MSKDRPLRVLMVARSCHATEIAQMTGLRDRGVDLRVVVAPRSPYLDEIKSLGIPVESIEFRSHFDFRAIRRLRQRIEEEQIDIAHALANRAVSNLFWASIMLPVRLVAYRGAVGHVKRVDPGAWLKWYNPRINHIVCVSEAVRTDMIRSGIHPERLTTIYKGHELGWYENRRPDPLKEFNLPGDAFVVGFIASMRPVKGADVLIRAINELRSHENIHCLLIGEVRDERIPALIERFNLTSRVHLAGHRRDAIDLIGQCDVVAAPSRGREGLTKAVIEGMAQGLPAVVSNAGGLPEMVEDGETGFVVPIDDYSTLADRIAYLAEDCQRAQQMGDRARSLVASRFSVEETVTKTLALYESLRPDA